LSVNKINAINVYAIYHINDMNSNNQDIEMTHVTVLVMYSHLDHVKITFMFIKLMAKYFDKKKLNMQYYNK